MSKKEDKQKKLPAIKQADEVIVEVVDSTSDLQDQAAKAIDELPSDVFGFAQKDEGLVVKPDWWPEPTDPCQLIISGQAIKLEETMESFSPDSLFGNFSYRTNRNRGLHIYERERKLHEALKSKDAHKWYYAKVNGVEFYLQFGSKVEIKDLSRHRRYGSELEQTLPPVLYVSASSIFTDYLYLEGSSGMFNTSVTGNNVCFKHSKLKESQLGTVGCGVSLEKTAINGTSINVAKGNINIRNAMIDDCSIKIKKNVYINHRAMVSNCDFSDSGESSLRICCEVRNFKIHIPVKGREIYIAHRAHFGYIQGLAAVPFVHVVSGEYEKTNPGMCVSGRVINLDDFGLQEYRSGNMVYGNVLCLPPEQRAETKIKAICLDIFNRNLRKDKVREVADYSSLPSSIAEQLVNSIEPQIHSRLKLWKLLESLDIDAELRGFEYDPGDF